MKNILSWVSLWSALFLFFAALFAMQPARAEATLQLGTILDDDDGGIRMVTLAGNDRSGIALNFGQTLHEAGVDDGDNEFLGADWFVKFNLFRFAVGASYWSAPLHRTSEKLNAHLGAAFVFPVNRALSLGAYFDHWSNCRRICNHRLNEISNDPRNTLSLGAGLVF